MDTTGENARKKKPKVNRYLPNHLIISNILCRLPAKKASQSRLVCKGWRDQTMTQDFVDLHLGCSFPTTIMVAYTWRTCKRFNHILLDKWWETGRKRLMTHRFSVNYENFHSPYATLFSHGGLIVFRGYRSTGALVTILNPTNNEKVTITIDRELFPSTIYGVFFHPSLKEYCSLLRIGGPSAGQVPIEYKMLILSSSPDMKTISNPYMHRVQKMRTRPLFIDKYLYWMLECEEKVGSGRNDIMQFDIIGEEFNVKPCPVPVETECNYSQTHLLNINGALSFIVIFPREITVWKLNNDAKEAEEELWTATNYSFSTEDYYFNFTTEPVAVVDGKLALLSDRRLVVCNLMQGSIKCCKKTKYPRNVYLMSHQMSLASLKSCQSTICIDEKGEVQKS